VSCQRQLADMMRPLQKWKKVAAGESKKIQRREKAVGPR